MMLLLQDLVLYIYFLKLGARAVGDEVCGRKGESQCQGTLQYHVGCAGESRQGGELKYIQSLSRARHCGCRRSVIEHHHNGLIKQVLISLFDRRDRLRGSQLISPMAHR